MAAACRIRPIPEFQALQAEESTPLYDTALVGAMLPLVPGIVERLEAGIDVADVGCGQGHAVNVMAQAFPNSRFVGYDFSEEGIAAGRAEAEWLGLANARFEVRDVANLGATAQFDLVTAFDTIHDQAQPRRVLRGIVESLRPDGALLMMDMAASSHLEENIEHPMGPLLYAASTFHCMTVSLAQGGEGLGTVWGEQKAAEYLTEAGFTGWRRSTSTATSSTSSSSPANPDLGHAEDAWVRLPARRPSLCAARVFRFQRGSAPIREPRSA